MKQIYILALITFITCVKISAQTTDVVTGLDNPNFIKVKNNELYISEFTGNKISKIDLNAITPTTTDVITNVIDPYGIQFNGNDLYISESNEFKIW